VVLEIGLQEDRRISGPVSLSELEEIGMHDGPDLKENGDYVDSPLDSIVWYCHSRFPNSIMHSKYVMLNIIMSTGRHFTIGAIPLTFHYLILLLYITEACSGVALE
jgi:hypothetical protein